MFHCRCLFVIDVKRDRHGRNLKSACAILLRSWERRIARPFLLDDLSEQF